MHPLRLLMGPSLSLDGVFVLEDRVFGILCAAFLVLDLQGYFKL